MRARAALASVLLLAACGRKPDAASTLPGRCQEDRLYKPRDMMEVLEVVEPALKDPTIKMAAYNSLETRLRVCMYTAIQDFVRPRDEDPTPPQRRKFVADSPSVLFMHRALRADAAPAYAAAEYDCMAYLLQQRVQDRRVCWKALHPQLDDESLNNDAMVYSALSLRDVRGWLPPQPKKWRPAPETGIANDAAEKSR